MCVYSATVWGPDKMWVIRRTQTGSFYSSSYTAITHYPSLFFEPFISVSSLLVIVALEVEAHLPIGRLVVRSPALAINMEISLG